jgi:cytochrome c oxidase subunit 1
MTTRTEPRTLGASDVAPRFGILWGLLLAAIGFVIGVFFGHVLQGSTSPFASTDQNDVSILLGYSLGTIGWLAGLGFLRYPLQRLRGRRPGVPVEPATGAARYVRMSTDHKVIGLQYLTVSLFFFFLAGLFAMFMRVELMKPYPWAWNPGEYLTLVGLHSGLMIIIMSAALLGPLGNYLVPLMIGARRMAFPRIEALGFWLVPAAAVVLLSSIFIGGFMTGWTGYAPLADQLQAGMDSYIFAFFLFGMALILTGFNLLATIVTERAPGMGWRRLPIFVWGVFGTSVLMTLGVPTLIVALFMEAMDRTVGTNFFVAQFGGTPYLFENLFWFFGHPEVYILALPGFGIVLELLPVFARKPLWGYRIAVAGILGVMFLSFSVWQHHLFVSGMNASLRPFYMLSTELISIPTGLVYLSAMGTLWKGKIRFDVPMLFSLAFFWNFLIGGLAGVFSSDVPSDVTGHGSFFVLAHFHFTIMGGLVFALVGALYYWLPKMTGVRLNDTLAKWQFWIMFISFNSTFFPMLFLGMLGMPRRASSYNPHLQFLNDWASISAFVLGFSMFLFLVNLVWSIAIVRSPAERNPWQSRGLEWMTSTPPPVENFPVLPLVIDDPYEYGVPHASAMAELNAPWPPVSPTEPLEGTTV